MNCSPNIITANFSGGRRKAKTAWRHQWDHGQVLCVTGIEDLPLTFTAHFSVHKEYGAAQPVEGIDGQVEIPDIWLTFGKQVYCWIYITDGESGETVYTITIPVIPRPMPEYYEMEDTGVFDGVVAEVSEYAETAQTAADNAGASASAAAASADSAAASATAAAGSATAAAQSKADAALASRAASTAAQDAKRSADAAAEDAGEAAISAHAAMTYRDAAEAAATEAKDAKADATTAAGRAESAAMAAGNAASGAGQAATAAGQYATSAGEAAGRADTAAQTATTKAADATAAAETAVDAKTAAQTAQQGAETAETNAGQSALTATEKAAEAAQSASSAAQSKTDAEAAATRAEQAAVTLTVDTALSDTSTNPVQNKVITGELTDVKSQLEVEHTDQEDFTDFALSNIRHVTDRTSELIQDHYLSTNAVGETLDPTNIVENTGTRKWAYTIFQVSKGDIIRYEGSQVKGLTTRCLVLTDDEYVIYYAGTNETFTNRIVQIQVKKDGYCVCNAVTVYAGSGTKARYKIYHITEDTYSNVLDSLPKIDDSLSITKKIEVPCDVTLVANEYVDSSGAFKPYNNWSRTDYIDVSSGSLRIVNGTGTTSNYNFFYDSEHNPIGSRFSFYGGETVKSVPSNAKYAVLSAQTSVMQNVTVYTGDHYMDLADRLPLTDTMREEVEEIAGRDVSVNMPRGLINPTAYIMKTLIPSYYFARNETPESYHDIGYLDDKINSVPDGYHFLFVTDTHWNDNAMNSTKLISYVRDRIGATYVLFGGDILTAHNTNSLAYRWLCDFVFDYKNAFGSNFLPVVGNHDLNASGPSGQGISYSDLVPVFTQGCDSRFHYCDFYDDRIDQIKGDLGMTDADAEKMKQYFRTCYYLDDDNGKTRYIVYNTGAGNGGSGITQFISSDITGSYEELLVIEWMYSVLMSTPEGYNVVACTHIPAGLGWDSPAETPVSAVRKRFACIFPAMKAKSQLTISFGSSVANIDRWCDPTLTLDFSNAPDIGTLLIMGGHYHVDTFAVFGFHGAPTSYTNVSGKQYEINGTSLTCYQKSDTPVSGEHKAFEVPIIITQHDAYTKNSMSLSHQMTKDTITEQVVDVVTICPNGDIALTRIGAGNDRYVTIV